MIYKTLLRTLQIDKIEIFFLCNKCTWKGHSETKHHTIRTVSKTNRKIVETERESQQILKWRCWLKLITMTMHKLYHWKEDMLNIPLLVYIVNFACLFNILRLYNSYRYGATYASNVSMILIEHAMMVTNTFVWKLLYGCCSFAFVLSCLVFVVVFCCFLCVLCWCLFFAWFIAFVVILLLCLFCFCIIHITET